MVVEFGAGSWVPGRIITDKGDPAPYHFGNIEDRRLKAISSCRA
jgi:hypothetical protein